MVKIRWKFERGKVYLEVVVLNRLSIYYWFPKAGLHKRFHPRQIFTRQIHHSSYEDPLIPRYVGARGWVEGEIEDKIVREKLGIPVLTQEEFFDQLGKAC